MYGGYVLAHSQQETDNFIELESWNHWDVIFYFAFKFGFYDEATDSYIKTKFGKVIFILILPTCFDLFNYLDFIIY